MNAPSQSAIPGKPLLIEGGFSVDERGRVSFVNSADLYGARRLYFITNSSSAVIRAWQAHKREAKYFYAVTGQFQIVAVKLDSFTDPSPDLSVEAFILQEDSPSILFVPPGYANGIRALSAQNKLLVLSNLTLKESSKDIYRFPAHLWFDWNK